MGDSRGSAEQQAVDAETGGLARDTLRKAVKVLKDEGLVETEPGMGIYVERD